MAVVKAPALSMDASGNLGGICYSTWRGLHIAREPWTGTVPNTGKQQAIQGFLAAAAQRWSNVLSTGERDSWRNAAQKQVRISRVGTTYIPTGYNYFIQLNMQAKRQNKDWVEITPEALVPYGFERIQLWYDGVAEIAYIRTRDDFVTIPPGYQMEVWRAGPYDGGGRNPIDPEYRFQAYAPLNTWWQDPAFVEDKYYWYRIRWVEEKGRVGNWFEGQLFTD